MATNTDIIAQDPGWIGANTDPKVGFAVNGSGDVAGCVEDAWETNSYQWLANFYYHGGDSWWIYNYGISAIPTFVKINSLTAYWREGRNVANPGSVRYDYDIGGTDLTAIASHVVGGTWTWQNGSMSRPGGGSWTRSDLSNLRARIVNTAGASQDGDSRFDQHYVRVNWEYITLLSLSIDSFTNITINGATVNWSFNANGDGDTEWLVEWGTSPGSYPYNTGWRSDQLSGTGAQSGSYTISNMSPGQDVYVRFRARNHGNENFYSSESSFKTLGAGCLILMM